MTQATLPPPVAPSSPAALASELHRFTVDEYEAFGRLGVLTPEHRVELIRGYLMEKPVQNEPHAMAILLLERALRVLPPGWFSRPQLPIRLADSMPEPDSAIVAGSPRDYRQPPGPGHPRPAVIAVVVEISDSTLNHDRTVKLPLYADNGIPTYWIVNIPDGRVEVYAAPAGGRYATQTDYRPGDAVPLVLDGVEVARIAVNDLLP